MGISKHTDPFRILWPQSKGEKKNSHKRFRIYKGTFQDCDTFVVVLKSILESKSHPLVVQRVSWGQEATSHHQQRLGGVPLLFLSNYKAFSHSQRWANPSDPARAFLKPDQASQQHLPQPKPATLGDSPEHRGDAAPPQHTVPRAG